MDTVLLYFDALYGLSDAYLSGCVAVTGNETASDVVRSRDRLTPCLPCKTILVGFIPSAAGTTPGTCKSSEQSAQRVASMPYTAEFASARCLTKLHQPHDVDVVSEPSCSVFSSFLSPIFRVGVCRHLTHILSISLIFLGISPLHNILAPGPAKVRGPI